MEQDQLFMRRCIELAKNSQGFHQPNPEVGAVVVYNGKIIGEGYHARWGGAHAEVHAIDSIAEENRHLLPLSTIYVTLEPCAHFGKTPPCVDLLLRSGFRRVVIGCQDPYLEVAGRSIAKLRSAGVEVRVGVLQSEIEWMNRRFFLQCRLQRPYIILKYATSADGYLGKVGERVQISNRWTQQLLHQWRSEESAILVGTTTALIDNPQLTNRLHILNNRQPVRLLLDRQLRLPTSLHLFDGSLPTWVFTEKTPTQPLPNVEYITINFDAQLLENILNVLQQRRIQSLLVEGGAQLLQAFIAANLWDETRIFIGSVSLGDGIATPLLKNAELVEETQLDDNKVQIWKRKYN